MGSKAFLLPNLEIDDKRGKGLEDGESQAMKTILVTFAGKKAGEKFIDRFANKIRKGKLVAFGQ